ncbi:MAG: carboxypeptidase regulatory-like domain-containing protein [Comamonadaceae bacterium]|nr:MAG: carboxypeptidase regulatory-like domain-containing protein [Comamonadaceae bacterium]
MLATVLLGGSLVAHAQTTGGVPPMKGEGSARYVCGGIGTDESIPMRAAMKEHPLSLRFAQADGSYTAELDVVIKDAKGASALTLRANGPICLIDLPAGRYTVEASDTGGSGARKSQTVTLGGTPRTVEFRF